MNYFIEDDKFPELKTTHEFTLWKQWVRSICGVRNIPKPSTKEWDILEQN